LGSGNGYESVTAAIYGQKNFGVKQIKKGVLGPVKKQLDETNLLVPV
jgi:hypothetical protein